LPYGEDVTRDYQEDHPHTSLDPYPLRVLVDTCKVTFSHIRSPLNFFCGFLVNDF